MAKLITYNTQSSFDQVYDLIKPFEGGFQNDPDDHGNYTKKNKRGVLKGTKGGISALSYPHLDIKNLTSKEIKDIYFKDYWQRFKLDKYPSQYRVIMFDMTINHGFRNASRILQEAINSNGGNLVVDSYAGSISRSQLKIIEPDIDSIRLRRVAFIRRGQSRGKIVKWWGLIDRALSV